MQQPFRRAAAGEEGLGYVGGLKYAFGPQSYARLVTALGSTPPTSAADSQVSAYADEYFEYASSFPNGGQNPPVRKRGRARLLMLYEHNSSII